MNTRKINRRNFIATLTPMTAGLIVANSSLIATKGQTIPKLECKITDNKPNCPVIEGNPKCRTLGNQLTIKPEEFGVVPNVDEDQSYCFQLALQAWRDKGGRFECAPHVRYRLDQPLKMLMCTTDERRYELRGNGAMLDFSKWQRLDSSKKPLPSSSNPNPETEFALKLGSEACIPGALGNMEYMIIDHLVINGPDHNIPLFRQEENKPPPPEPTGGIKNARDGLSLFRAHGVRLRDIDIRGFRIGLHTDHVWPLSVTDCIIRNNYFGAWLSKNTTHGIWQNVDFLAAMFGIMMWPFDTSPGNKAIGSGSIHNQRFIGCRFEDVLRLGVMNPNGKDNIYSITFRDTYVERIGVREQTGDFLIGKIPIWHELPVWKNKNNEPWTKEGSDLPTINSEDKDKQGWIWDIIITGGETPADSLNSGDNLTPAHISVGNNQVCNVLFNGEDIHPSKRCPWSYKKSD
jgi:hypothetical protein